MHIIHISYLIYIYIYLFIYMQLFHGFLKKQYSGNKQCSSTLCNFTLGRVLDYNTSLKEYH